ncbi:MAG TPA: phage holin family protein [Chitinophagaceae bacterium]|nr:phage holin family protein [Chitinophagaceae bacterium]
MEKVFNKAEELILTVKKYVNGKIEAVKVNTAEKISVVMAAILARIVSGVGFLLFVVFGGIALSIILGQWIGKPWAGFLIVAGFYLLMGIIVWKGRVKLIQLPVMNALIKQLFKHEDED